MDNGNTSEITDNLHVPKLSGSETYRLKANKFTIPVRK